MEKRQFAGHESKVLHLALLGCFDIRVAGSSLDTGYAKLRALLAFLAMSVGIPLRREYLAELLWPEMTATGGRQNLRRALFNLKSIMGGAGRLLSAKRDVVMLSRSESLWLDVAEFTASAPSCIAAPDSGYCNPCIAQMEYMAGFYRGEFMAGFSLPGCPDFEGWLQLQRESLHRRALAILERLTNCHEQINGYGKALPFALRYTELEPWGEEGHRRAIRLYALNGQSSAALGQYDFCCRILKKELGVLPDDETRSLADSIRKGEWRSDYSDAADEPPVTALPALAAERRHVTVLYCEFALAATGEPDEAATLLRAPQARCAEIIREFSGYIVQAYGGGLLAYFGYPQAHEYAARHAVQAAMAVTREAAEGIEIRAGVHTGLIITGGEPSMPDTVGNTSMLTIQLRHGVAHNEVAISRDTRYLVGGYFDCISMGVQSFPGAAQPLEIFKVIRESGAHTRLDAAAQLTPFVGRKAEITKLMGLWKKATQGTFHVVLVQGEAGIGKSRLLHTLKMRLADFPHAICELRCFPEFSQSPFHPLIAMLEAVFGFTYGDKPEVKFGKLAQYFETHYTASAKDAAPLLAQLLSLSLCGNYRAPGLSPQKQKKQTISILLDLLRALAAQQPVLLIVGDLHWVDPSTLELLTLLVEQTRGVPILAVFTARPDFAPPWKKAINSSTLALAPLAGDEIAEIIASNSENLLPSTVSRIVERADGVPLFAEEMSKVATMGNQTNIPATLHDLLAARIDNMGEAKYTAQLAATIGREFDLDLLRKVFPLAPAALTHALDALRNAGLILNASGETCQFKHALIQETAYQSQTMADRQDAHRRIAQSLESDFPDIAAARPELLAQHFSAGGKVRQAIEYWIKAGQRAALNSANLEAIGHFNSGLQLLMTLPADQERDWVELKTLVSLCPLLYAVKGHGSDGATQANARISALSGLVGDSKELFHAKWVLVFNTITNSGATKIGALETAIQLLGMAHGDPLRKQAAHYAVANAAFWLGEFETTRIHAEQAISLHQPDQRQMLIEQFGDDLSVTCEIFLSHALYFLGFPDRAQLVCGRMLTKAKKHIYPHTLAFALSFASLLYRWLNKPAETLSLSAEAILVSRQHDFPVWLSVGEATHGWALVLHGQEEGIAELKSGIAGMRQTVSGVQVTYLSPLAEACVHLKRYDEALPLLAEALGDAASTGDDHFVAELQRLKGVCLLEISPSNAAQAESCFGEALTISRRQQAKSLELRAAMSMARLWGQQGRQEKARCVLEETCNGFTEGFDTPDLQEASKLMTSFC